MIDATNGLEGIVVANTVLSEVDGEAGRLVIRGFPIDVLSGHTPYEGVARLLLDGFFKDLPKDLAPAIGEARKAVFSELTSGIDPQLLKHSPIEVMRALVARLSDGDELDVALKLIAAPAVFTAAVVRAQAGQKPIAPDSSLSHAADILRMLRGKPATPEEVHAFDAYLVTVCDHGLNASTFAARVVASTHAGLTSSIIAGISALKGPLHGGAPGPIIEMLDSIGKPENATAWLAAAVEHGDRLMGFGHRIYHVRDPRADVLKQVVKDLATKSAKLGGRLAFAEAVETAALAVLKSHKPNRSLQTNVEFYTALLLEALAFPPSTFTCVFAMGRVSGWIAHAKEQVAGGRLIRPQSQYVGPAPQN